MARLTLRLPDSLHEQLAQQARSEGVSLNQYIVFALTKAGTASHIAAQRAYFQQLQSVVSDEEAEEALQALLSLREEPSGGRSAQEE